MPSSAGASWPPSCSPAACRRSGCASAAAACSPPPHACTCCWPAHCRHHCRASLTAPPPAPTCPPARQITALFQAQPSLFKHSVQRPDQMRRLFAWLQHGLGLQQGDVVKLITRCPIILQARWVPAGVPGQAAARAAAARHVHSQRCARCGGAVHAAALCACVVPPLMPPTRPTLAPAAADGCGGAAGAGAAAGGPGAAAGACAAWAAIGVLHGCCRPLMVSAPRAAAPLLPTTLPRGLLLQDRVATGVVRNPEVLGVDSALLQAKVAFLMGGCLGAALGGSLRVGLAAAPPLTPPCHPLPRHPTQVRWA